MYHNLIFHRKNDDLNLRVWVHKPTDTIRWFTDTGDVCTSLLQSRRKKKLITANNYSSSTLRLGFGPSTVGGRTESRRRYTSVPLETWTGSKTRLGVLFVLTNEKKKELLILLYEVMYINYSVRYISIFYI